MKSASASAHHSSLSSVSLSGCCAARSRAWEKSSGRQYSSQTSLPGSCTPGANLLIVSGEKSQGALSSLVQAHQPPEYMARLPNISKYCTA